MRIRRSGDLAICRSGNLEGSDQIALGCSSPDPQTFRLPDLQISKSPDLQISKSQDLQISRSPDPSDSPDLVIWRSGGVESWISGDLDILRSGGRV